MKLLLGFLLLFSVNKYSSAQNYIPLLDSDNEWHVTSCEISCITDEYYSQKDTFYNGLNYTVLDGYHYISKTFWLREDISQQKVFMSFQEIGKARTEIILYDFSLNIGDSMELTNPISPFPKNPGFFKLDSIKYIPLYNGTPHRFFYLSPSISSTSTENPIWVEGIGSLNLINAPGGTPDINGVGKLSCFFKNGIIYYADLNMIEACDPKFVTSTSEIYNPKLAVFPTLVTDFLTIKNTDESTFIQLINLQGEIVQERLTFSSTDINLNVSSLKSGVYIVRVRFGSNQSVFHSKIIKQ